MIIKHKDVSEDQNIVRTFARKLKGVTKGRTGTTYDRT